MSGLKMLRSLGVGLVVVIAAGVAGCSDDSNADEEQPSGGGGVGGTVPVGGMIATGGTSATGGTAPSGGVGGIATGGVTTSGGIATGGATTSGGIATGGATTGGVMTGGVSTGGIPTGTGGSDVPSGDCDSGPLSTSIANCEIELPAMTGDYHQDCVNVINAFRWQCHCLPPLERWTEGENCANAMAEYDAGVNTAHAAFSSGYCEPTGWAQCECPGWGSAESITQPQSTGWGEQESCLEMMWHEVDHPQGQQGHYEAMSDTEFTAVACGIHIGTNGEVWAVQNYYREPNW